MSDTLDPINGKPRKRQGVKTASRQTVSKLKTTIHLSVESSQRLSVHAAMLGMDRSELIESLISKHLRRFVVSDRGGGDSGNSGIDESQNG
jgi:hypothetical protein